MRTLRIVRWLIAILLALIFVGSAIPKLMGSEQMVVRFEAWGYPAAFSGVIGVVEIVGGLMVLFPRAAFLGAALLSLEMVGAVFTHLRTGIGSPSFAFVALALAIGLAWLTRLGSKGIGEGDSPYAPSA